MPMIIPITTDAVSKAITVDRYTYDYNCALQVVGVLAAEIIAIQQPTVEQPVESNDAHWAPVKTDGTAWTLTADNNACVIPGKMTVRIVKPASLGNPFGISYA